MGLEIEDDETPGGLLSLPCAALQGRRCRIYAHRPECCRTFECRLLQEVRRGEVSVESARAQVAETLKRIGRVRELMGQLGHHDARLPLGESCAEALAGATGPDPEVNRKRAELEAAMSAVEERIRTSFLGGRGVVGETIGERPRASVRTSRGCG
jgi:hypothetical protein